MSGKALGSLALAVAGLVSLGATSIPAMMLGVSAFRGMRGQSMRIGAIAATAATATAVGGLAFAGWFFWVFATCEHRSATERIVSLAWLAGLHLVAVMLTWLELKPTRIRLLLFTATAAAMASMLVLVSIGADGRYTGLMISLYGILLMLAIPIWLLFARTEHRDLAVRIYGVIVAASIAPAMFILGVLVLWGSAASGC